ncbi:hypothetical protein LXL04_011540 [Taraxacum kok-saghyz]
MICLDAVFKRPHLDSFWEFCFERFNVGIWSTKHYDNLLRVVQFLLPTFEEKLLFIWDGSRSTKTKIYTIDNKKPIEFKYLRKFWESNGPCKFWVKGYFNESNTLLVDDSPYKAFLNHVSLSSSFFVSHYLSHYQLLILILFKLQKNTAIFPPSYNHKGEGDNFLGELCFGLWNLRDFTICRSGWEGIQCSLS